MSRRKISKKKFACNHKGFGKFCHRCDTADKLEAFAKSDKEYKAGKNKPWTKEELISESDRLRKEGKVSY